MSIGYACINLSLGKKITTNRTMVKRTFIAKGVDYVSDLVLQNVADLERIIDWNEQNGIKMLNYLKGHPAQRRTTVLTGEMCVSDHRSDP